MVVLHVLLRPGHYLVHSMNSFTIKQEVLEKFSCLGHFRARTELHFREIGSFF